MAGLEALALASLREEAFEGLSSGRTAAEALGV
jgi:hypothetical protein